VAPHIGHVSNFGSLRRSPLEPGQRLCSQGHPSKTKIAIQAGHPGRAHFEPQEARISPARWLAVTRLVELPPGPTGMGTEM